MAKKVTVALVDDTDGTSAATETVNFALDGVNYEIDLSDQHAQDIRSDIGKWITHARKTSGRTVRRRPGGTARSTDQSGIRQWAIDNGYEVPKRGRVRAEITRAYNAAQATPAEEPKPKAPARKSAKKITAVEFSSPE